MRIRAPFVLSGLLCATALSGCAADHKPDLAPIPAPVQIRIERQPIDAGLLTCAGAPAFDPAAIATDLDLLALAHRYFEAWSDCANKLARIRKAQAEPIGAPVLP
jgi:hypothetical protein